MRNLEKIHCSYRKLYNKKDFDYYIPEIWLTGWEDIIPFKNNKNNIVNLDIVEFFPRLKEFYNKKAIENKICSSKSLSKIVNDNNDGSWIKESIIYSSYIRHTTSFDHNNDGILGGKNTDITLNSSGIRETGTFFKTMLILPYLKMMGINTLYLLPVALSGIYDKKGELPSPYSQRNPLKIEPTLSDPLIDATPSIQFGALVEACHSLGIRVILDFIFRTSSKDSDWIFDHPDWFYWIEKEKKKDFASPFFTKDELVEINKRVENISENDLIPPHGDYRNIFYESPDKEDIVWDNDYGYLGKTNMNKDIIIPGAFADWPPDDVQPPWSDVTYLKLFNEKEFNYIAYNTIRMYDRRIKEANYKLWDTLSEIIPFYQDKFGIDGARIDMGHALPHELEKSIISKAKENDKSFSFLSENFNPKGESSDSGYNAVWGSSFYMQHRINEKCDDDNINSSCLMHFIDEIKTNPLPVLGTPETNDTPRVASRNNGAKLSELLLTINFYLPGVIPFIPAGMEFYETAPSNLGLDFEKEYIDNFNGKLALFDRVSLNWDNNNLFSIISGLSEIRNNNKIYNYNKNIQTFSFTNNLNAFFIDEKELKFIVIANFSNENQIIKIDEIENNQIVKLIRNKIKFTEKTLEIESMEGRVLIKE